MEEYQRDPLADLVGLDARVELGDAAVDVFEETVGAALASRA